MSSSYPDSHYRASFSIEINAENRSVVQRGRTGKFVPANYGGGEPGWREIAKGRIINVYEGEGFAEGEIYFGGNKKDLESALDELSEHDFLEIDQYGASAKVLSGLAEYYLVNDLTRRDYRLRRMPEDMAKYLGSYANYDFQVEKEGVTKRVEVKSLRGTNTKCARLIHSTTTRPRKEEKLWTEEQKANYYPTSSCKFKTQDIFVVSLFLRTGDIADFAFTPLLHARVGVPLLPSSPALVPTSFTPVRTEADLIPWRVPLYALFSYVR